MSEKEAERLRLMKNHAEGRITLSTASSLLGLSYRQTLRIWNNFKLEGTIGIVSKKRKNQNRLLDRDLEERILSFIRKEYHDYGPTLIAEKLEEKHQIRVSRETIRKLMIKNGLRDSKKQKKIKVYQRRKRRNCFGELVQLDGSPHAWFEDRGPWVQFSNIGNTLIHLHR